MDIGLTQAGFDVLAQIEIDPHCCDTLRFNAAREHRKTLVYEDDIRKIAPEQLMRRTLGGTPFRRVFSMPDLES